ncbi:YqgQ family protein [Bacillus sp. B1-b2]|uniref:YqgQ family protein n=1 Tax=Bacillus sp. B1-b2 TaxID=2653201 RepID=UPI001262149D|nr:YqgQ family protein [Bacillus sp. B1-b2]KAB7670030.1 YqgQ family protein [Bacillus sp. B1-b2]
MKTIYDIQQFLKKYGTIIYIGDRLGDLQLMKTEIVELDKAQLMNKQDFETAIFLLNQEIQHMQDENSGGE